MKHHRPLRNRTSVADLIRILDTPAHRRKIFDQLHELRRVFTVEKRVMVLDQGKFGLAMKRLREDAGIPQKVMAKNLKVSPGYLAQVEAGNGQLGMVETLLFLHWCDRAGKT